MKHNSISKLRRRAVLWLLLLCGLYALPLQAALVNCPGLSAFPGDYKILLDDFSSPAAQASNAELTAMQKLLVFNFKSEVKRLTSPAERPPQDQSLRVRLITCVGRSPTFEGDEFTPALVERLSDERVVVELWGSLNLRSAGGQAPITEAMIGYVIPPLQHYEQGADAPPSLHVVDYSGAADGALDGGLNSMPELRAFALIGLGTKAARARSYDLAIWAFTHARTSIADAQRVRANPDLPTLLSYVKQAACKTRATARADRNYVGPLRIGAAQACGGGR